MPSVAAPFPPPAPDKRASRLGLWLQHLRRAFAPDDDADFLLEATDLADLERRLRRLERGRADRFGPCGRGNPVINAYGIGWPE